MFAGQYGPEAIEYPDWGHASDAPVLVLTQGSTPAVLYSDRNRASVIDNPIYTDDKGNLRFYAEPGFYRISTGDGSVSLEVTVYPDPFESVEGSSVAETVRVDCQTSQILSGHKLVVPMDDGRVEYADAYNPDHAGRPILLTLGSWGSDVLANLHAYGPASEPSWNWTAGNPIYLGADGAPVQSIPIGAAFIRRVAEVISSSTIMFCPQQSIVTG